MSNNPSLDSGTYEIIRQRLNDQRETLQQKLKKLNQSRKTIFGQLDTKLLANDRIRTQNNCLAADIVALDDVFIFGYNVHIGLRSGIRLEDVFTVYKFIDNHFKEQPIDLLQKDRFVLDFNNLYNYYRDTIFRRFVQRESYLYMVFQTSEKPTDLKAFKWLFKDGELEYLDDRSGFEISPPPAHEFQWKKAGRDQHIEGQHPHISIEDRLFVETVGGDLTIKIEDNTNTGLGIYEEPVAYAEQTLDDAEFYYADLINLIALKIKPYREKERYFLYNEKVQEVKRVDALEQAGILLPDGQGVIFSNGYYLQTGGFKLFDQDISHLQFEQRIIAPNGEDCLFVFYDAVKSDYVLLSYNVIQQTVQTPIICNGFTIAENGILCYFKQDPTPTKNHLIQIWQTPYSEEVIVSTAHKDSHLFKIGNKDIVQAMADCQELVTLLNQTDSYAGLYDDLVKKSTAVLDNYFWLDHKEAIQINEPIKGIKEVSDSAIAAFEKVQSLRKNAKKNLVESTQETTELLRKIKSTRFDAIPVFVENLAALRTLRGKLIGQKEVRYIDVETIEKLEESIATQSERLSNECVQFLLREDALKTYLNKIEEAKKSIPNLTKVSEAKALEKQTGEISHDLELLIEIVSNLKIEDATHTTQIVDNVSELFAKLNQVRAALKKHYNQLRGTEANAEFNAQFKLIDQGIINFLDLCETPKQCEEYLTKMLVQLEELEAKFADFEDFTIALADKRAAIYDAFEARKSQLTEERNKRALSIETAAKRILNGMQNRVDKMESANDINSYFAGDLMVEKYRNLVQQLEGMEDNIKAEGLQSQLKSLKESALRQLTDRKELFVEGENIIKFGNFPFTVNVQALEGTIVERENELFYHLTGTRFFEKLNHPKLQEFQPYWNQSLLSENDKVYRSSYLAWQFFADHKPLFYNKKGDFILPAKDLLLTQVQQYAASRLNEGYVKGIHPEDATVILQAFAQLDAALDTLKYDANTRILAQLFWYFGLNKEEQLLLHKQLKGLGAIRKTFISEEHVFSLKDNLSKKIASFISDKKEWQSSIENTEEDSLGAANYLIVELSRNDGFAVSKTALQLSSDFELYLKNQKANTSFKESTNKLKKHEAALYQLLKEWIKAFLASNNQVKNPYLAEAAWLIFKKQKEDIDFLPERINDHISQQKINDLQGTHSSIKGSTFLLNYHNFTKDLKRFTKIDIPNFKHFTRLKKETAATLRKELKLDSFKPKILSSFVRNQLINDVFLPLIGENLAKQIGTAGDTKRTDLQGLLLLISPPGYGKTTLMEYITHRLGLTFMKINGPSLGHDVTSLDPSSAKNAAAREELTKLNLAFEMGDNAMIYIDDIQHCHPEFLQKFISLCDAQRKIEGVWKGDSKTYDLRGRKVCIVMAGNPYTESGERFQIPDMLANRADIYNLGDIIGGSETVFKLSYLENSLTSNPTLAPLNNQNRKDIYTLIQWASNGTRTDDELEGDYAPETIKDYITVFEKALKIRDVILTVNQAYIESAAQEDAYRTEPPFRLQGSYRDMNKMVGKVVPIMNDKELEQLILTHYESEAQTLTSGAEANLLKFKEMTGRLTEEEMLRWATIKEQFVKQNDLVTTEDKMSEIIKEMNRFANTLLKSIDKRLG